jgi:hypothetical protein
MVSQAKIHMGLVLFELSTFKVNHAHPNMVSQMEANTCYSTVLHLGRLHPGQNAAFWFLPNKRLFE